jgi:putative ABC transport system ATP-binding protein
MALVEVCNVTKEYRRGDQKITPLREVSLEVEAGDFVSLMGASGSGKSTLLNLIAGIDRPTAGRIVVGGADLARLSRTRLAQWRAGHVGYVFQSTPCSAAARSRRTRGPRGSSRRGP